MKEISVALRNSILHFAYTNVLKRIFFRFDPEDVHDRMIHSGNLLGNNTLTRSITKVMFSYQHPMLSQEIFGIKFRNPIGLAAGFDKNAQLTQILPSVGFGFEEVGSITGEPCEGNPRPRLYRLKDSKSLGVYYGLKNDGCEVLSEKLSEIRFSIPIGISVAKTNNQETVDTQKGIDDYVKAYKAFQNIGSYYTINISCPNTFGGQPFTSRKRLDLLLNAISKEEKTKPILIKISPDLSKKELDDVIDLSVKYSIDGLIVSNLTKNRNNPNIKDKNVPDFGGLSGKVVEELSNEMIAYIYKKAGEKLIIVGCGGIFNAEDAYKKIKLGASLLQLVTGMVFEGPQVISDINRGLVKRLKKDGYKNISDAVGKGIK